MRLIVLILLYCGTLAQPPTYQKNFTISTTSLAASCPNYGYCSTEGNLDLYWGVVASECSNSTYGSGLRFALETPGLVQLGIPFTVATLYSRNTIIQSNPGAPPTVFFTLNLTVDSTIAVSIQIQLEIDETENQEPCAYPSTVPCADKHHYIIPQDQAQFTVGGTVYNIQFPASSTNGTEYDVIIQEDCSPELFAGDPITLPLVITCASCCPVYIWADPDARMYLPWNIYLQSAEGNQTGFLTVSGGSVAGRIILEDVLATEKMSTYKWSPHRILPGRYRVAYEYETCSQANFTIHVR